MREANKRCEHCINNRPNVWCNIFGTTIRWSQVNACYDCEFRKEQLGLIKTNNGRADQFKPMREVQHG